LISIIVDAAKASPIHNIDGNEALLLDLSIGGGGGWLRVQGRRCKVQGSGKKVQGAGRIV